MPVASKKWPCERGFRAWLREAATPVAPELGVPEASPTRGAGIATGRRRRSCSAATACAAASARAASPPCGWPTTSASTARSRSRSSRATRVVGGRFEREARAAARLAHPGIVTLYEAAVDDEGAYLVSELVHGTTLDELLAAGRLSDRDVVQIGIALCDALAHAHAHGVVHRDVKPSNVLVPDRPTTPAQIARLTDFGVARVLGGDSLTRTGDVIGTAAYMAPEQAEGLPAGAAADLFSLALVLYEGLSGVNPVRTGAAARRAGMHLPPLRRQRRDLPRELGRAIDLSLRPRPGERGTLDELRARAGPRRRTRGRRARSGRGSVAGADGAGGQAGAGPRPRRRRRSRRGRHGDGSRPGRGARSPGWRRPGSPSGSRAARRGRSRSRRRCWRAVRACSSPLFLAPAGSPQPRLVAAALAIHGQSEAALLVAAGALVPVVLSPRDGPAWPLAAVAPALACTRASPPRGRRWPGSRAALIAGRRSPPPAGCGPCCGRRDWLDRSLNCRHVRRRRSLGGGGVLLAVDAEPRDGPRSRRSAWRCGPLRSASARRWPRTPAGRAPTGVALLGALAGALVALVTRRLAARLRRPAPANESAANVVA